MSIFAHTSPALLDFSVTPKPGFSSYDARNLNMNMMNTGVDLDLISALRVEPQKVGRHRPFWFSQQLSSSLPSPFLLSGSRCFLPCCLLLLLLSLFASSSEDVELLLELSASALTSSVWWLTSSLDRSSLEASILRKILANGLHRDLLGLEEHTCPSQWRRKCQKRRLLCSLLCQRIGWFHRHQTCITLIFCRDACACQIR